MLGHMIGCPVPAFLLSLLFHMEVQGQDEKRTYRSNDRMLLAYGSCVFGRRKQQQQPGCKRQSKKIRRQRLRPAKSLMKSAS